MSIAVGGRKADQRLLRLCQRRRSYLVSRSLVARLVECADQQECRTDPDNGQDDQNG